MERPKLKTATGKEFDITSFTKTASGVNLFIQVKGKSLPELAAIFSNPEETGTLYYGDRVEYGFTKLATISNANNVVRISLTKEF